MTQLSTRHLTGSAALALFPLLALLPAAGCNQDEGALVSPRNGVWIYQELEEVSNSCSADLQLDPPMSFAMDYDGGDTFDIERGADDIHCEINGYDFTCGKILVTTVDLNPAFDAEVSFFVAYEGTFDSEEAATGSEIVTVTCTGPACEDQLVDLVPCATEVHFAADFQVG